MGRNGKCLGFQGAKVFAGWLALVELLGSLAENEKNRAYNAKCGPQIVPRDRPPHIQKGKRDKNAQRDGFLKDFQLRKRQETVSDPIRGDHEHVLKKGDPPRDQNDLPNRRVRKIFQVRVPREKHERVGADQEENDSKKFHGKNGLEFK